LGSIIPHAAATPLSNNFLPTSGSNNNNPVTTPTSATQSATSPSAGGFQTLGSNHNNPVTTPSPATLSTATPSAEGFQNLGSSTTTVTGTSAPGPVVSPTPPVGANESSQCAPQQLSSYFSTPEEKAKKVKQAQAMQALISVTIFCDRDTSGRFDDWVAHLEAALALGDFDEGRKLQLMRSKLYGEAAEEFDTFKLDILGPGRMLMLKLD
jgi:hypothetical protein